MRSAASVRGSSCSRSCSAPSRTGRPGRRAAPVQAPVPAPSTTSSISGSATWDVTLPDGKRAGNNRIEPILGGCVLRESWAGATGGIGTSYNA